MAYGLLRVWYGTSRARRGRTNTPGCGQLVPRYPTYIGDLHMFKTRLVRSVVMAFAVGAVACLVSQDAQAQNCYRGSRVGGFRLSVGYGGYGGYGTSISYYSPRYRRGPVWHDTSHYDFYPGRYVRHRGHYDYIPPHYGFHRTGHYHH